jgi:hypothetical protein
MSSNAPTTPPLNSPKPSSAPRDPAADTDPLLHLHKMSTTAGVGSQDYVAVNVTSVVAVLFGLASLLAILSNVLLVIPVVGVILGLVALHQVRSSNETQTGKALAILGLFLSAAITAAIFCYQFVQDARQRADEAALSALCVKYGNLIANKNFDEAYTLFDSDFQTRVSEQAFKIHLASMQQRGGLLPPIDGVSWNGLATFHPGDDGTETADAMIKLHFQGSDDEPRAEAHFRRSADGTWLIDNIPQQFPPLRTPPPSH